MRRATRIVHLVPIIIIGASQLQAQNTSRHWGREWQSLDSQNHMMFVGGVATGNRQLRLMSAALSDPSLAAGLDLQRVVAALRLSSAQIAAVQLALDSAERLLNIDSFGSETVAGVMDQFYSDAANDLVPWVWGVQVAVLRLRGATPERVDQLIAASRRAAAQQ